MNQKETKGITLIALVITIIVLLILAGVTIAAISGNEGVLDKAQGAKTKTDVANAKEAAMLKTTEYVQEFYQKKYVTNDGSVAENNAGEYIAGKYATAVQTGDYYIQKDGTTGKIKVSTDAAGSNVIVEGTLEDNGTITWGDGTPVTPVPPAATIPEKLQVAVDNNGTITYRKIYVNYTFPGGSEATKCVVMYSDAEHGVQIIPENPITKVKLGKADNIGGATGTSDLEKAQNSYQNAVANLNEKAKLLAGVSTTQTRIATNIAQDARCVGSLPDVNAGKTEFSREDEQIKYVTEDEVIRQVAVGKFTNSNLTTSFDNQYWDTDENYKEDETRLKDIGAYVYSTTTNGSFYWVASRGVGSDSNSSNFRVRSVGSSGSLRYSTLWSYSFGRLNADGSEYGFRPVILLKSGVQIKEEAGKDGTTADKAYNLE